MFKYNSNTVKLQHIPESQSFVDPNWIGVNCKGAVKMNENNWKRGTQALALALAKGWTSQRTHHCVTYNFMHSWQTWLNRGEQRWNEAVIHARIFFRVKTYTWSLTKTERSTGCKHVVNFRVTRVSCSGGRGASKSTTQETESTQDRLTRISNHGLSRRGQVRFKQALFLVACHCFWCLKSHLRLVLNSATESIHCHGFSPLRFPLRFRVASWVKNAL